jgi:hypothetical protein
MALRPGRDQEIHVKKKLSLRPHLKLQNIRPNKNSAKLSAMAGFEGIYAVLFRA